MFYYIKGELVAADQNYAVLDVCGVGYKLTISANTRSSLPPFRSVKEPPLVLLYTHFAVREDDVELFGFSTEEELKTFRTLTTVSGIGPKAAMSILSTLTPQKLALAVSSEDKRAIAAANGIGAKTAARVILELKDKAMEELDDDFDIKEFHKFFLEIGPTYYEIIEDRMDYWMLNQ